MNNTQNTTIVLLLVTAGILTAMLLSAYVGTDSVAYGDASVRQGKYIAATGAYDKDTDVLYIINVETQKMAVYAPNLGRRQIDKVIAAKPLQAPVRK